MVVMVRTIGLDNGHGLATAGKRTDIFTDGTKSPYTGKNFMHEWEFNRRVVELLKVELERCGFRTLEISPSEVDMPINDRYQKANAAKVDYFLSIHANALTGKWNAANGVEVMAKKANSHYTAAEKARVAESFRIGRILQEELVAATGLTDRCKNLPNKVLESTAVGVLNWTKMPANLAECGFMDNLKEAKLLLSEDYRKLCAVALAKGLCRAFGIAYKEKEVDDAMTPAEKKEFDGLRKDVEVLKTALASATLQVEAPAWFVVEFKADKVLDRISTKTGSTDFWRSLAVSLRMQGLGNGKFY